MIRDYLPSDETAWLRCRVLAFLDTDYYDDVQTSAPGFDNPTIRLVSEADGTLDGLLDIEIFPAEVGSTATIDCIAVHPDRRRAGIGSNLFDTALSVLPRDVTSLDAWTREDQAANAWYRRHGFVENSSYLHVYKDHDEATDGFAVPEGLGGPVKAFLRGRREDESAWRQRFRRVYVCRQYLLRL